MPRVIDSTNPYSWSAHMPVKVEMPLHVYCVSNRQHTLAGHIAPHSSGVDFQLSLGYWSRTVGMDGKALICSISLS